MARWRRASRPAGDRLGALRRVGGEIREVANANSTWRARTGLLLRVEQDGVVGFGEASPLPGYSPDSIDEAEADLRRWIDAGCDDRSDSIQSPSARFAAETACLDLEARRRSKPLWRLVDGSGVSRARPVQGLVPPCSEDESVRVARAHVAAGLRTLKLKVGPEVDAECRRLEALRRELGDGVALRLDANRSLPLDEAHLALAAWAAFDVEWIEEPCAEPGPVDSPIRLAFDETLRDSGMSRGGWKPLRFWCKEAPYAAVVLKPTVLGWNTSVELARWAKRARLDIVISHAFEGPVAFQACAHLALAVGSAGACGLARHAGLDAWPEVPDLLVGDNSVDPERQVGSGLGLDGEALWRQVESRPEAR